MTGGLAGEFAPIEARADRHLRHSVCPRTHRMHGEIGDCTRSARDAIDGAKGGVARSFRGGRVVENFPLLFQFHGGSRAAFTGGDALKERKGKSVGDMVETLVDNSKQI